MNMISDLWSWLSTSEGSLVSIFLGLTGLTVLGLVLANRGDKDEGFFQKAMSSIKGAFSSAWDTFSDASIPAKILFVLGILFIILTIAALVYHYMHPDWYPWHGPTAEQTTEDGKASTAPKEVVDKSASKVVSDAKDKSSVEKASNEKEDTANHAKTDEKVEANASKSK